MNRKIGKTDAALGDPAPAVCSCSLLSVLSAHTAGNCICNGSKTPEHKVGGLLHAPVGWGGVEGWQIPPVPSWFFSIA